MKGRDAAPDLNYRSRSSCPVLNCPLEAPFLPTLAGAVLRGSIWNTTPPEPHELPAISIYLPAHASVEPLKLAFLAQSPNKATFLPRIRVLGDVDPLDLFAAFGTRIASANIAVNLLEKALAIPAAFTKLERELKLSALISQAEEQLYSTRLAEGERVFANFEAVSAYTIARDIASIIDETLADEADMSRLFRLDGQHGSGSEQLSLQLLQSVYRGWQAYQKQAGKIDHEERRNRLMAIESEFIAQSDAPVIIAGSAGTIAATTLLMQAVRKKPNSAIVLHGLDEGLDAEIWAELGEHPEHHQHGLHQLFLKLGIEREEVSSLPPASAASAAGGVPLLQRNRQPDSDGRQRRARFLNVALYPPFAAKWPDFLRDFKQHGEKLAPGLSLIEAETIQEESETIALILRDHLENSGETAALVTPDRKLMARVRHCLARWGLVADKPSPHGADLFATRVASCAASGKSESLLALLQHAPAKDGAAAGRAAEIIDLGALRQIWRPLRLGGLSAALARAENAVAAGEARDRAMKRIGQAEWQAARALANQLVDALSPLTEAAERRLGLADWVSRHAEALSRLKTLGFGTEEGKDASLFDEIRQIGAPSPVLDLANYAALFNQIVETSTKAERASPHPRLFLWTPLDSRLLTADIVILAGLNEGCWPAAAAPSPWLNRGARDFLGLVPEERRIGQSAHDFVVLAASASQVVLTRSRKVNGSLSRPSRWISRIKALAAGTAQPEALAPPAPWRSWARQINMPQATEPASRPEPRPPLAARPRRLSVTDVETWFANPYAIYAKHILRLEPLRPLEERGSPRDKGILFHTALRRFFQTHRDRLPADAAARLAEELEKAARDLGFDLENAPFWRPRFARFAAWLAEANEINRADIAEIKSEVSGKLTLASPGGAFEITARADRIDRLSDGSLRIYDFKTSANAAKTSAKRGAPQLALEGLLALVGSFPGIPAGVNADLAYIVASGGEPPGEIVTINGSPADVIQAAFVGAQQRIARFDDERTPYAYAIRAIYRDKAEYDPYAQLARVQEWRSDAAENVEAGDD